MRSTGATRRGSCRFARIVGSCLRPPRGLTCAGPEVK